MKRDNELIIGKKLLIKLYAEVNCVFNYYFELCATKKKRNPHFKCNNSLIIGFILIRVLFF
jgi:hypothetical protein